MTKTNNLIQDSLNESSANSNESRIRVDTGSSTIQDSNTSEIKLDLGKKYPA